MPEPESKRYIKQPRKGDAIRTGKYGDVTVDAVTGYGRNLLVTDMNGAEHMVRRADNEQWLRIERLGAKIGIPEAAIRAVAEVRLRQYGSEYEASHLTWYDFADDARELLEAALPHLGSNA